MNFNIIIHTRNPDGRGWVVEDGVLSYCWMVNPPAPSDVTMDVLCKCKKSACVSQICSCKRGNLPCSELCQCVNCENCSSANTDTNDDNDGTFTDDINDLDCSDDEL